MLKHKQITFDLDTNVLKQIHGEKNYTKAYSDIRSFMKSNNFEHIEGSVYASKDILDDSEVLEILDDLKEKHEYLDKSVKDLHQTDIGETHSLGFCFDYDGTPGKFAQKYQEKDDVQSSKTNITESISASRIPDYRKQITFDLDTNVLKQIHGEKNYTKGYSDIRCFMKNNGFEHIEGSAYASKNIMSNQETLDLLEDLKEKHAYLDKSIKELHQTDIAGASHSLTGHFNYDGMPGKFAQKDNQHDTQTFGQTQKSSDNMDAVRRKAYLQYIAANCGVDTSYSAQIDITNTYTPP